MFENTVLDGVLEIYNLASWTMLPICELENQSYPQVLSTIHSQTRVKSVSRIREFVVLDGVNAAPGKYSTACGKPWGLIHRKLWITRF
jgi:hypothetical protein